MRWLPRRRWLRYATLLLVVLLVPVLAFGVFRLWLQWPRVALRPLLTGEKLNAPLQVVEIPDAAGEMAVVEKGGRILRFKPQARKAAGVLVDLTDRVFIEGYEDGLLALAFHPRFEANRRFFVYYTAREPRRTVLAEYRLEPATRSAAGDSGTVVLEVRKPHPNHNGGGLVFDAGGMLMLGIGDSQISTRAASTSNFYGTIIRIDVDGAEGERPYAIPPDNPFLGDAEALPEVWAYGLRNPWRMSFDRETGELYVGDVGSEQFEEVNRAVRGASHGFPFVEGEVCHPKHPDCDPSAHVPPLAAFSRTVTRAIIGGHVYRGEAIPWLQGRYVFGTLFRGLYTIPIDEADVIAWPSPLLFRPRATYGPNKGDEIRTASLGEDLAGELYLVDLKGGLYRIVPR